MRRYVLVALTLVAVLAPPGEGYQRPGANSRVSVSSKGAQGNKQSGGIGAGDTKHDLAMTPDARFVAFTSMASNLVAGDTNGMQDVFVRDRLRGTTERVSVASDGSQGSLSGGLVTDAECRPTDTAAAPAISADGRYVVFHSCFPNLAGTPPLGDVNRADDVFVHDRRTHTTTLVSVDSRGLPGDLASTYATISDDGRYVAFQSTATNLDPAAEGCEQSLAGLTCLLPTLRFRVYVHDLHTGATTVVPLPDSSLTAALSTAAFQASISPDGRLVSYASTTANPKVSPMYLYDRKLRATELVSRSRDGSAGGVYAGGVSVRTQTFSANNRYVLFEGYGGFVPNDAGRDPNEVGHGVQVYVLDRTTDRIERVSVTSSGGGLFESVLAAITRDGRYVVFTLWDDEAYVGSPTAIAVHDRVTGATELMPMTGACRQRSDCAGSPDIGAGGRYVAFSSGDDKLVPRDTNKAWDVFVRDRGTALGTGLVLRQGVSGSPGASVIGAAVVERPSDLFVRIELARMPGFALASPATVYGVDLTAGGVRYQVRAAKVGLGAAFGLFRHDAGGWVQVATLDGGYGTSGQQVVAAVPRALVGGHLGEVTAFTGLGSFATGVVRIVDQLSLAGS